AVQLIDTPVIKQDFRSPPPALAFATNSCGARRGASCLRPLSAHWIHHQKHLCPRGSGVGCKWSRLRFTPPRQGWKAEREMTPGENGNRSVVKENVCRHRQWESSDREVSAKRR